MSDAFLVVLLVMAVVMALPPLLNGVQGWLRDRSRRRALLALRQENAGVLLASMRTEPAPAADVAPALVTGSVVRCLDATRFTLATIRQVVGGEVRLLGDCVALARDEALERMRSEARAQGYDAVVNVRLETTEILGTAVEVLAYGTAIRRRAS